MQIYRPGQDMQGRYPNSEAGSGQKDWNGLENGEEEKKEQYEPDKSAQRRYYNF